MVEFSVKLTRQAIGQMALPQLLIILLLASSIASAVQPPSDSENEVDLVNDPTTPKPDVSQGSETTSLPASSSGRIGVTKPSSAASSTPTTKPPTTLAPAAITTIKPKPSGDSKNCPINCRCTDVNSTKIVINCSGLGLTTVPNFKDLNKFSNISEISLRNNLIESINLNQLPLASLEQLDLSSNLIQNIVSGKKFNQFNKLVGLNLSRNRLGSANDLTSISMPLLTTLDLSGNPISKLNGLEFSKLKSLGSLYLNGTKLTFINGTAFEQLVTMNLLSLKNTSLNGAHLPDQLFSKNQNLRTIDLSMNGFYEVPMALRTLPTLENLKLSQNLLTSLRPSDFINLIGLKTVELKNCPKLTRVDDGTFSQLSNLKDIIISNNPSFDYFSPNAFKSLTPPSSAANATIATESVSKITKLDLRNNNISTLVDITEWPAVRLTNVLLDNNPWDCSCNMKWLLELQTRSQFHCRTPSLYRDMEIDLYFKTVDCELEESGFNRLIVGTFLIFLLLLTIAVFVQKSDLCRRYLWREQYGTIYYTKASFPTDQV